MPYQPLFAMPLQALFKTLFRCPFQAIFKRHLTSVKSIIFNGCCRPSRDVVLGVQKGRRLVVIPMSFQAFKMMPFRFHYKRSRDFKRNWRRCNDVIQAAFPFRPTTSFLTSYVDRNTAARVVSPVHHDTAWRDRCLGIRIASFRRCSYWKTF